MDRITKQQRSKIMSSIKSKDTKPELFFEKKILPQKNYSKHYRRAFNADFVYKSQMVAIFVDGTFWHGKYFDYNTTKLNNHWKNHIQNNINRDKKNRLALEKIGWIVLSYWEDELEKNKKKIKREIINILKERTLKPPLHSQIELFV